MMRLLGLVTLLVCATAVAGAQDTKQPPATVTPADNEAFVQVIDPKSDIPVELLAIDYRQCFDGCKQGGIGEPACKSLCVCSIREFQKRYVNKSYVAVRAQMSFNRVDEANRIILNSIGEKCGQEAVDAGLLTPEPKPEPKPGDKAPDK